MFSDKIKNQESQNREFAKSGGWYKFQEGENRFRILQEPELIFKDFKLGICYTDCGFQGSSKFLVNILDRKDGTVKLAELPYTIGTTIAGYQIDEDYKFEGFPMPYDIKVNAVGAGTKEVSYTVIPGRATESLSEDILDQVSKLKPLEEIIVTMKSNNKEKHIQDGTWDKNHLGLTDEQKASIKASRDAEVKARQEMETEVDPETEIPF